MQAIVVWMSPNEVHDIAMLHSFRYDGEKWWLQRNANEWQDVLVAKPFPPNDLLDKELRAKRKRRL